jgi:single-strand DNA-binding protein
MNSINLVGRLTKDPELRSTGDGTPVCDLRLAVNGRGKASPLFIDVATFNKQAEACAKHLGKGSQVAVAGSIRHYEWETDDGQKRSKHSVLAREVQFLDGRPAQSGPTEDREDEDES